MTRSLLLIPFLAVLTGCTIPIDIHSGIANTQLAAHCKLLAYSEDRSYFAMGLTAMLITQANETARRQAIYDACLEARL
jgi:hypothetical protein